jgi:hypothetical protein
MRRTHGLIIVALMAVWVVGYGLAAKAGRAQASAEGARYAALEAQQSADAAKQAARRAERRRRRGWFD